MTRLDRQAIRRSEDCYVDELFSGAVGLGAPMLVAHFPRSSPLHDRIQRWRQ